MKPIFGPESAAGNGWVPGKDVLSLSGGNASSFNLSSTGLPFSLAKIRLLLMHVRPSPSKGFPLISRSYFISWFIFLFTPEGDRFAWSGPLSFLPSMAFNYSFFFPPWAYDSADWTVEGFSEHWAGCLDDLSFSLLALANLPCSILDPKGVLTMTWSRSSAFLD